MKILVCAHKEDYVRSDDLYTPIQVGCDLTDKELGFLKDNTGDNISSKNGSFCELTALYWAWKNLPDEDVIGLAHYRRYLNLDDTYPYYISSTHRDLERNRESDNKSISEILTQYDVIVAQKSTLLKSVEKQYIKSHGTQDLQTLKTIISEIYPEYIDSFNTVMRSYEFSPFNMFIAKREFVDDYCKWMFDTLFELEKRVDISKYSSYQRRVFGFIAERLLNVYIHKHQFKVKYCPIIKIENNAKNKSYLSRKWHDIRLFRRDIEIFIKSKF